MKDAWEEGITKKIVRNVNKENYTYTEQNKLEKNARWMSELMHVMKAKVMKKIVMINANEKKGHEQDDNRK